MTKRADLVDHIIQDYRTAPLSEAERAMLAYAEKLSREPASIASSDIEALREHGYDDRAILDICLITAYYNFANRVADGLGVELEGFWKPEEVK